METIADKSFVVEALATPGDPAGFSSGMRLCSWALLLDGDLQKVPGLGFRWRYSNTQVSRMIYAIAKAEEENAESQNKHGG